MVRPSGTFTGAFNLSGNPALSVPVGMVPPTPIDTRPPDDADLPLAGM